MPKPFKLQRAFPLPDGADVFEHAGRWCVRMKDERGRMQTHRLTQDGRNYLKPSKAWYFNLRLANGTIKRVKGFPDLKATETHAAEMERKESRKRAGCIDPAEEHARKPLTEHLQDYAAFLEAKGGTGKHIQETIARVQRLQDECGFVFPPDVDAGRVAEWLNTLRRNDALTEIPPGDSFTPGAVAKMLRVSGTAIAKMIQRLDLPATGNGKARRLPRATVEAIALNRAKGAGPATVNHYIRAVRGFFRWLVKTKRIGSNPVETIELVNERADVRRQRRELTADELRKLIDTTRASTKLFRGLTGEERAMLYLTASGTGFRANSLANLTPEDFNFEDNTVTLSARYAKNRRTKIQPMAGDVAEALRGFVAGKPAGVVVWGGTWAKGQRAAEMLRGDLRAAGIAYAVEGPDGPEYADFHALRHSYITMLGRNGVDLRTVQELAGHSTPTLTARYSHRRLHDLAGAVDKLPALAPSKETNAEALPLRRTGTTDAVSGVPPGVLTGVPNGYTGVHSAARICTMGILGGEKDGVQKSLENATKNTDLHSHAPHNTSAPRRTRTYNPLIKSLKVANSNPLPGQTVTENDADGCTTGCTTPETAGGGMAPELARVVAAWPGLPEAIKRAMLALIEATPKAGH